MSTATIQDARAERIAAVGYEYRPTQTVTHCPACEWDCAKVAADVRPDRYGFEVSTKLCPRCALRFFSKRLDGAGFAEFYQSYYRPLVAAYSDQPFNATLMRVDQRGMARAYADFAAEFLWHPARRTCLDIGGSTGAFCDELVERWDYSCTVLDPAPDELAFATKHCTLLGTVETWQDFPDFSDVAERYLQWDVIACLQTIDHVTRPLESLQKMRGWLNDDGILLIDFVNYFVHANDFGLSTALKIDHPCNFTPGCARTLLYRAGFEVVKEAKTSDSRHRWYVCRKARPVELCEVPQ